MSDFVLIDWFLWVIGPPIFFLNLLFLNKINLTGPSQWLNKLNNEELNEYLTKCNYAKTKSKREIKKKLKYFVKNGEIRKKGDLKFAAVLVNPINGFTVCGASFITKRHLVSARHCFVHYAKESPTARLILKAGGVCHSKRQNDDDGCDEADMQELTYKFAIFTSDSIAFIPNHFDFAIIELDNDVNNFKNF